MNLRDTYLDCLRGCAIMLVVVGHYLQSSVPDFDTNLAFTVIYAFHMPLFMFICGRAAAYKLAPRFLPTTGPDYSAFASLRELPNKAARLVLPFFAWAIVAYLINDRHAPIQPYLAQLVSRPDMGLWFLPTLFCIHVAIALAQALYRISVRIRQGQFAFVTLVLSLLVGWLVLVLMRRWHIMTLASYYYPFFGAGLLLTVMSQKRNPERLPNAFSLLCFGAFACLLPFWHRTSVDTRLLLWLGEQHAVWIRAAMATATAVCGISCFQILVRRAMPFAGHWPNTFLRYLGSRTLPIYAVHLYFLGLVGNAFAIPVAIILSVGIDYLLQQNRWTRLILLGERRSAQSSALFAWRQLGFGNR